VYFLLLLRNREKDKKRVREALDVMSRGRGIAAGNIGSLLDALRGQQVSGWLRAQYSQGGYLEEGELYIHIGQPIYARTRNQSGHDAFNHLLSWRNIYFSFSSDQPRPEANLFPERTRSNMTGPLRNTNRPPSTIPARTNRVAPTANMNFQPSMNTFQETEFPPSGNKYQHPGMFSSPPNSPHTDVLPPMNNLLRAEQIVPHKVGQERDPLTLSLTRRQRFVYFMVDGQRTIDYIARCTNWPILEVELILRELEEQALIEL
jgi:hypothetical protein